MSAMGFPSPSDLLTPTETDPAPGYADVLVYNVSVHISPNGHCCTYLGLVDSRSKRFLSTKLACYDIPAPTKLMALRCLYSAVTESFRDELASKG